MVEAKVHRRGWVSLVVIVALVWGGSRLAQHVTNERIAAGLRGAVAAGDIHMLSSQTCVFCDRARNWLVAHEVPFQECFIELDSSCRARYERTGARGTPTLLVRGRVLLGFDKERVLRSLDAPA